MATRTLHHDLNSHHQGARDVEDLGDVASDHAEELLRELAATPRDQGTRAALRARVIEAWLPLAERLARRYAGRGEPLDDLTQTASVGLIKAVDRYDSDRGGGFVTFAVPTILGEIRRYFRDRTWDLRVPRRLQELQQAIKASADSLAQELRHAPTAADLAADLDVSRREIVDGIGVARAYQALSLDARVATGDADTELGELLGAEDPGLAFVELRLMLAPAVARLPEREQRILRMRFYHNLTQAQIAERIGVSQMHVSRLLSRSLARLRDAILDRADPGAR